MHANADCIRTHGFETFIKPARGAGLRTVSIIAGHVHKDLGLQNRMPAVCSALDSAKFLEPYNISVIRRIGPPQGSSVTWILAL